MDVELITEPAGPAAVPPLLTALTCVFLHGGWMHFLGNMWFLWIFGDNVEDRFGHFGYVAFYVVCGLAASIAHYLSDPASQIPTIGASGAIAGVMGAYFVWYSHSRVTAIVPLGGFIQMMEVPARWFLGVWFGLQFLQGVMTAGPGGGVAWWRGGPILAGLSPAWRSLSRSASRGCSARGGTKFPQTGFVAHSGDGTPIR
ncbi:MAG: rhomboid family intramembrane serine protease [Planctomycetaceae bacterium]